MNARLLASAALAAVLVLAAACGTETTPEPGPETPAAPASPTPSPDPPPPPADPPPAAQLETLELQAVQVADGPELLTSIAWRPDDPVPYLADQEGEVYRLENGEAVSVLDWTDEVHDWLQDSERGLMGMVFDPVDGRLILGYNQPDLHTRVVSFAVSPDGVPDPDSAREILFVEQPGLGHNSGQMAFDVDGNLWIAMGDGGGSRGADAQDPTSLHGKILRITPNRDSEGYTIPPDNPYVDDDEMRDEVWALGLRNPFRFSIDHPTGDVWIGDVGQDTFETVYRIRPEEAGANLGWPRWEGSREVHFSREFEVPDDAMQPIHEYDLGGGQAVIGGYVYRGSAISDMEGAYVFMNFYRPVWAMGAEGTDGVVELDLDLPNYLTSFGQDPDGELWILSLFNGVYQIKPA